MYQNYEGIWPALFYGPGFGAGIGISDLAYNIVNIGVITMV